LDVRGVVDFMSAPEVQQQGVDLLADEAVELLVIDLAGVTFIDSSGLSVLVYLKGRCDERGIELSLRNVPTRARTLIDSLGLSTYFEL
jgi:anti-anti-sigma factor